MLIWIQLSLKLDFEKRVEERLKRIWIIIFPIV